MKKSLFAAALAVPLGVASLALAQSPTPRPVTPPTAQPERLSEAEIRQGLESKGYTDVRTVQANGDEYQVEAQKDGRKVTLLVNARTGRYNERAS